MALSREERIRKLREQIEDDARNGCDVFGDFDLESLFDTSENRFEKLQDVRSAIELVRAATTEFGRESRLEVRTIADTKDWPILRSDSHFKYSTPGGGSIAESRVRLERGEPVSLFVALEQQVAIGYALVEQDPSSVGFEVKIVDVELASRRTAGLKATIQIENESFEIGVGHVLVASILDRFHDRLRTDATHDSSRYVFRSLGFSPYSKQNPCLLQADSCNAQSS